MSELQSILQLDVDRIRSHIGLVLDQEMGRVRDTLERDLVESTTKRIFDLFQSNSDRIEDELWDYEIETEELIRFIKERYRDQHNWYMSNIGGEEYRNMIANIQLQRTHKFFVNAVKVNGNPYDPADIFMYSENLIIRVSGNSNPQSINSINSIKPHKIPNNILLAVKMIDGGGSNAPSLAWKHIGTRNRANKDIPNYDSCRPFAFLEYFKAHPEYFLEQSPTFNTIVQRQEQHIQKEREELRKERALLDLDLDVFQRQKKEFLQSYRDVEGFEQERKEFEEEKKRMALVKIALHRERQSIEQEREALRKEREALQEAQSEGINLDEYFKDITTDVATTTKNIFQTLKTRII